MKNLFLLLLLFPFFLSSNELIQRFENSDYLELNKRFTQYENDYWKSFDGNPLNTKKLKFCNDEFISEEIIFSFEEKLAKKNILYVDLFFLIADLYDKCNPGFITNKVTVKSIENIKKSIEITEDWVSKLTDNQKKKIFQDILYRDYYQTIASLLWKRAIRYMQTNPTKCHEDMTNALYYSKIENQDLSLRKNASALILEAQCAITKLNYKLSIENLDLLNLKFKSIFEKCSSGFLQCNDKKILINHFSIFNTYFSLSFNNSQRINQEQILKIKKQVKYVEELIDHFSKINVKINSINKDLKKLLSIHLDLFWLNVHYFSQDLRNPFENEIKLAAEGTKARLKKLKSILMNIKKWKLEFLKF